MVFPVKQIISQLHDKEGYFVRKKVTTFTKILELIGTKYEVKFGIPEAISKGNRDVDYLSSLEESCKRIEKNKQIAPSIIHQRK